jgi:formamidopyrimidine-DNA glycosylase
LSPLDRARLAFENRDAMPELPDITVYIEALEVRLTGQKLERVRIVSPFLLRTYDPPVDELQRRRVECFRRLGKRIAIGFEEELWLVLHLMIAGRLHWKPVGAKVPAKVGLAAFDFPHGTLLLTEAGSKKRASMYVERGMAAMEAHRPLGIEVLESDLPEFGRVLTRGNNTLKRALTDPHRFSGIGNAYSDEILHRARLSPVSLTLNLAREEVEALYHAVRATLTDWTDRLRAEAGGRFPEKVTAFRKGMAVHGRYGKPCPDCGTAVQRIRYADNETNYCPRCQTGGKVLADRSLSRLLKNDWPRTIEELEGG